MLWWAEKLPNAPPPEPPFSLDPPPAVHIWPTDVFPLLEPTATDKTCPGATDALITVLVYPDPPPSPPVLLNILPEDPLAPPPTQNISILSIPFGTVNFPDDVNTFSPAFVLFW